MLQIAKVLKSNGIEGGLLVSAPEFDLQDIQEPVYIEFDGLPVPFFIESCRRHGATKYVITITDVCSLKDAEELVGKAVYLDSDDQGSEDEMPDFTGWTIDCSGSGARGVVSGMEPIPGNLCLYVNLLDKAGNKTDREVMIPLHEDFIVSADPSRHILTLELPEGLL